MESYWQGLRMQGVRWISAFLKAESQTNLTLEGDWVLWPPAFLESRQ